MITEIGAKQVAIKGYSQGPSNQPDQTGNNPLNQARQLRRNQWAKIDNQDKNPFSKDGSEQNRAASDDFSSIVKEEFNLINNVKLKFTKDKDTGQTYIQVVDKETGETLREIPPEEARKLAEKLDEMVGLIFDKKA